MSLVGTNRNNALQHELSTKTERSGHKTQFDPDAMGCLSTVAVSSVWTTAADNVRFLWEAGGGVPQKRSPI